MTAARGEVLRGDHFQRGLLAVQLIVDGLLDLGIDCGKSLVQLLNHGCSFEIPLLHMTDISV